MLADSRAGTALSALASRTLESMNSAAFIDEFSDVAVEYAAFRPTYPRALFDRLAELSPARRAAWDCGTGSGQAAIGLAEFFDCVHATDASAAQLARATPHPRVHYRLATAENCGLPDRSVELVSVASALHWFDLDRFFAEVRRVARSGALLAVYGYHGFYITPALDELTERWLLRPVQSHWAPNNQLLADGYRTIPFPFEQVVEPNLAIHVSWTLSQLLEFFLTWSAPRRKIDVDGDGFVKEAHRAFEAEWGDPERRRHVVIPLIARIGRVT